MRHRGEWKTSQAEATGKTGSGREGPAIVADRGDTRKIRTIGRPRRTRAYTRASHYYPRMNRLSPALAVKPNDDADSALRRELYFYTLYRLLEASMLVLVLFGPVADMIEPPRHDLLARVVALSYLFLAAILFTFGRRGDLRGQAFAGICCDLLFGILAIHAIPVAGTGIALMLMFNLGAAALLLPPRLGLGAAMVAVVAVVGEHLWSVLLEESTRAITEPLMFSVGYLAIATTTSVLGRQMRVTYDLAEERGLQTAHLTEVNELIIRRLRTGVLLVDGH